MRARDDRTAVNEPRSRPSRVSRRGFLGGALAATLAATFLRADRTMAPPPPPKARWIGHW